MSGPVWHYAGLFSGGSAAARRGDRESLMRGQFRTHSHTAVARSVRSGEHQPAVVRGTHLQRHFHNYSRACLLCTDERRCNHGSETTGGLTPPAVGCTRVCAAQKSFFHRRANDMHQERRVSARRGSGTGLAGECEFRRWTNHVKSGWRQPAVSREPRMQGKSQIASHRGFVQPQEQRASARRGSGTALAGECDSRRWTNHVRSGGREAAVGRETHLQERFRKVAGDCRRWLTNAGAIKAAKPRGAYVPRSCSRAFARRRNCDFCDAQSHIEKERRV